ncbi:MAG: response regulator transcription factor [Propionibacteriaceae bacterium]|jgi:DNA-binding response OmpR family regulator|nr:response regulator transcription factor [Propionibacteriaceae bacterium]
MPERRALVVEDEAVLSTVVAGYLARDGFAVTEAADGPSGLRAARETDPDVIVLDLGLPGMDGIEVCRQIRTFSDCYILMLTARADEIDTLIGLSVGADDYLTKPFRPRELSARVAALLRRPRSPAPPPAGPGDEAASPAGPAASPQGRGPTVGPPPVGPATFPPGRGPASGSAAVGPTSQRGPWPGRAPGTVGPDSRLRLGQLVIDRLGREVQLSGRPVELTRTEFDLLAALVSQPGRVFSRRQLVEVAWGDAGAAEERLVDSHLLRVRQKLGDSARIGRYVRTVRGLGYKAGSGV